MICSIFSSTGWKESICSFINTLQYYGNELTSMSPIQVTATQTMQSLHSRVSLQHKCIGSHNVFMFAKSQLLCTLSKHYHITFMQWLLCRLSGHKIADQPKRSRLGLGLTSLELNFSDGNDSIWPWLITDWLKQGIKWTNYLSFI